jgi:hypothetical protein
MKAILDENTKTIQEILLEDSEAGSEDTKPMKAMLETVEAERKPD